MVDIASSHIFENPTELDTLTAWNVRPKSPLAQVAPKRQAKMHKHKPGPNDMQCMSEKCNQDVGMMMLYVIFLSMDFF